jgi:hypothetical protein
MRRLLEVTPCISLLIHLCQSSGKDKGIGLPGASAVGVQVDYNVMRLRTSLVQLFVLLQNLEKVVQMIELKRFVGAPNDYPFAPLYKDAIDTCL